MRADLLLGGHGARRQFHIRRRFRFHYARAQQTGDRAEKLAAAICGEEESKAGRLATLRAEPSSLINALAARTELFARALDRCDVALNKALDGLG